MGSFGIPHLILGAILFIFLAFKLNSRSSSGRQMVEPRTYNESMAQPTRPSQNSSDRVIIQALKNGRRWDEVSRVVNSDQRITDEFTIVSRRLPGIQLRAVDSSNRVIAIW